MSKLRKSDLKEIVKQCLIEILEEGAGRNIQENKFQNLHEGRGSVRSNRTSFDHVKWQKENMQDENTKDSFVEHAAMLSDDPILAEVLADSGKTLQRQMAAERMGTPAMSGDLAAREVAGSNLEDLFPDSAGKWSTLAFE